MELHRILLLICCIGGGSLACRTNQICIDLDAAAQQKETENDITAFCPLQSKAIACLTAEGCSDAVLNPMRSNYYSKCSITAAEITQCTNQLAVHCDGLRTAANNHLPTDVKNYCSEMESYQTECLQNLIGPMCTNPKVTVYDVMGADYGHYEIKCQNTSFINCQALMTAANCASYVQSATGTDSTTYCRALETFMSCTNQTFTQCDQTLSLPAFYSGNDRAYRQSCDEKTMQCLMYIAGNCSSLAPAQNALPAEMCSALPQYTDCANRTLKSCDDSVNKDAILGPLRTSYIFQCGPEGEDACPAISTCMAALQTGEGQTPPEGNQQGGQPPQGSGGQPPQGSGGAPPQGSGGPEMQGQSATPNVVDQCGNIGSMLGCMGTEFGKCGRSSPRSYTFTQVSNLYTTSCTAMATNTNLMSDSCGAMSLCMANLPLPTDQMELAKIYYDPEFWCRLLRMALNCGKNLKDTCQVDVTVMDSLLTSVDSLCYPGGVTPAPVTPAPVTPDAVTPDAIETSTGPVSLGIATQAGVMTYLSLLTTVLLQMLR